MRKRLVTLLTFLFLALIIVQPVQAQEAPATEPVETRQQTIPVTVLVDGEPVDFGDAAPFVERGNTLVPLEPLFDALNIRAEQLALPADDGSDVRQATLGTKLGLTIVFLADAPVVEINGAAVPLPATARLVDGDLYIPARIAAEAAGYEVDWDGPTRTVHLERRVGGQGFLWEVNNGANQVYLLGSIHIADEKLYPLPPIYETAFDEADYIGVEVDLQKALSPESMELTLQASQFADGTTIKDHISAETYALLGEKLLALGLPADAFDAFKPWAVTQTLTTLEADESGYSHVMGIELYFLSSASARQLPIVELESMASQLDMFDRFSPELQEQQLLDTLHGTGTGQNMEGLGNLLDMWMTGDDEMLAELADYFQVESEEYYQLMLKERNIAMTEKIIAYLESDEPAQYLVIVGALHMLGEDGIIPLLEEAGYTAVRH